MNRIYFAYGMNMDFAAMARRCPAARCLGLARLPRHRFGINRRGVSTVLPDESGQVHGVLWALTRACEASLDGYEGVSVGHYVKRDRPVLAVAADGEREHRQGIQHLATRKGGSHDQPCDREAQDHINHGGTCGQTQAIADGCAGGGVLECFGEISDRQTVREDGFVPPAHRCGRGQEHTEVRHGCERHKARHRGGRQQSAKTPQDLGLAAAG